MDGSKNIFEQWGTFTGRPIKEKVIILKYLRGFKPSWVTSGVVVDRVINQPIKKHYNVGYEYDGFTWNQEHIYHFEKYDMPLKEEFVSKIVEEKEKV